MPNKKRLTYHIIVDLISRHVTNSLIRKQTLFIVTPTGKFYEVEGVRITEEDFFKLHPIEMPLKHVNRYGATIGQKVPL